MTQRSFEEISKDIDKLFSSVASTTRENGKIIIRLSQCPKRHLRVINL